MQKEHFKLSRVMIATFLATVVIIPAIIAIRYNDLVAVVFSEKTAAEQIIADAIRPITGRTIYIDCKPINQSGNNINTITHGETIFINGYAMPVIYLSESTCTSIQNIKNQKFSADLADHELQALITITHEAFHTTGVSDEAEAECYALQRIGIVATELGISQSQLQSLTSRAVKLQSATAGTGYDSSECRDNGRYDLDPEEPGFFPN